MSTDTHKLGSYRSNVHFKASLAVALGTGLLMLSACAMQPASTIAPTDTPDRSFEPTRTPSATFTPNPSPPSAAPASASPTPTPVTTGSADLAIRVKGSAQIAPGETGIYTVSVLNQGPDLATGVVFTTEFASGIAPLWAQPAQPLCGRQERSVNCDMGELQDGDSVTVTLDLSVGGSEDLITGTQLAGVDLDLSVPACIVNGDTPHPSATCSLDALHPGVEAHSRIGISAGAPVTGALIHTATVTALQTEPAPADNAAPFTTTISSAASVTVTSVPTGVDLAVLVEAPTSTIAGQSTLYTITIRNQGDLDATNVRFGHVIPLASTLNWYAPIAPRCEQQGDTLICQARDPDSGRSITFTLAITGYAGQPMILELDPLQPGWPSCAVVEERTFLHVIYCDLGTLRPGQASHVNLDITARGLQERLITGTAMGLADEAELTPLDNTTFASITVQVRADLAVLPTLARPASDDGTTSYIVTVANRGPSDSANVVLTETLPAGVRLVSAITYEGNECQSEGQVIVCRLGRLRGGAKIATTITIAIDEDLVPPALHTAQVTAGQADPNLDNNELTERIPIRIED